MKKIFFVLFFLYHASHVFSQSVAPLLIRSGKNIVDLSRLKQIVIVQNITSQGIDSLRLEIEALTIKKRRDTLFVKVKRIDQINLQDFTSDKNKQRIDHQAKEVKVPIAQIELIRAKKQPLAFFMGSLATISYLASFGAALVTLKDQHYNKPAEQILMVALPTLAVTWPVYYGVAKKKYHFDADRTKNKIWLFQRY